MNEGRDPCKEAALNAIRYSWTNGLVEGNVNRLKNKKREMYGRAGFELLRRKAVLSLTGQIASNAKNQHGLRYPCRAGKFGGNWEWCPINSKKYDIIYFPKIHRFYYFRRAK